MLSLKFRGIHPHTPSVRHQTPRHASLQVKAPVFSGLTSFFGLNKAEKIAEAKSELLEAIEPLSRGATASDEEKEEVRINHSKVTSTDLDVDGSSLVIT